MSNNMLMFLFYLDIFLCDILGFAMVGLDFIITISLFNLICKKVNFTTLNVWAKLTLVLSGVIFMLGLMVGLIVLAGLAIRPIYK
jgi:hypothetical protein